MEKVWEALTEPRFCMPIPALTSLKCGAQIRIFGVCRRETASLNSGIAGYRLVRPRPGASALLRIRCLRATRRLPAVEDREPLTSAELDKIDERGGRRQSGMGVSWQGNCPGRICRQWSRYDLRARNDLSPQAFTLRRAGPASALPNGSGP